MLPSPVEWKRTGPLTPSKLTYTHQRIVSIFEGLGWQYLLEENADFMMSAPPEPLPPSPGKCPKCTYSMLTSMSFDRRTYSMLTIMAELTTLYLLCSPYLLLYTYSSKYSYAQ